MLKACKTFGDYSEYVSRVRIYAEESPIEDAVDRAIDERIREGILKDFLEKNRAEARAMSIYEYDQEAHIRMEREDAFEEGREAERANTEKERQRADEAEKRAEDEKRRAEDEKKHAEDEKRRADKAEEELAYWKARANQKEKE